MRTIKKNGVIDFLRVILSTCHRRLIAERLRQFFGGRYFRFSQVERGMPTSSTDARQKLPTRVKPGIEGVSDNLRADVVEHTIPTTLRAVFRYCMLLC